MAQQDMQWSAAVEQAAAPQPPPVKLVTIDGLAVLRIIKHCTESLPQQVAGMLVGLDRGNGVVEVTNAFPTPPDLEDVTDYQMRMLGSMGEAGMDDNLVAWYQCNPLGEKEFAADLVQHQAEFQSSKHVGSNAVVIMYDPLRSSRGTLSLKAMRLTDAFMQANAQRLGTLRTQTGAPLTAGSVLEEVELKIRNPHLVSALLLDLADETVADPEDLTSAAAVAAAGGEEEARASAESAAVDGDFELLDVSTRGGLEQTVHHLVSNLQDLQATMEEAPRAEREVAARLRDFTRASAEHKASGSTQKLSTSQFSCMDTKEVRLRALLQAAQADSYAGAVAQTAGQGFGKLFLTGAVHRDDE